ncbi:MAG: hypothetical protein V4469_00855 [Patescibacteria group bacterium]
MTKKMIRELVKYLDGEARKESKEFGYPPSKKELKRLIQNDAELAENTLALHLKDILTEINLIGLFWSLDGHDYANQARVLLKHLCEKWRVTPQRRKIR